MALDKKTVKLPALPVIPKVEPPDLATVVARLKKRSGNVSAGAEVDKSPVAITSGAQSTDTLIPDTSADLNIAPDKDSTVFRHSADLSSSYDFDTVDPSIVAALTFSGSEWDSLRGLQTRLRYRMQQRLHADEIVNLTRLNPDQIAHALSESTYGREARDLGIRHSGSELVRTMVALELDREIQQLMRMTANMPTGQRWIKAYRCQADYQSLRAAMRARRVGGDAPISMLAPLNTIPHNVFEWLATEPNLTKDAPEAKKFAGTPFVPVLKLVFGSDVELPGDEVETLILQSYNSRVLQPASQACRDKASKFWIQDQAHFINILTCLAARFSGSSHDIAFAMMLPITFWREEKLVRDLLDTPTEAELIQTIIKYGDRKLFQSLKPSDIEAIHDANSAERVLATVILREAREILRSGKAATAAIWAFLSLLEREARNIWCVIAGCDGQIEPEVIQSLLVLPE